MALSYVTSLSCNGIATSIGSSSFSTDEPRFGARSFKVAVVSGTTGYLSLGPAIESGGGRVEFPTFDSASVVAITLFLKVGTLPTAEVTVLGAAQTTADFIAIVQMNASGDLWLQNEGGSTSAVAATLAADDVWHRLDLTFDPSGTCRMRVDSGSEVTVTGGTSVSWLVRVGAFRNIAASATFYYSDVWLADTDSEYAPADGGVYPLYPNADGGDASGWSSGTTSDSTAVDDGATVDNDTTYWAADNAANKRSVGFASLPTPVGVYDVAAVSAFALCREVTTTTSSFQPYMDDGTESATSGSADLFTSYSSLVKTRTTPPSGGAWSESGVNALEAGVIHAASAVASTPRVTAIWLEVWAFDDTGVSGDGSSVVQATVAGTGASSADTAGSASASATVAAASSALSEAAGFSEAAFTASGASAIDSPTDGAVGITTDAIGAGASLFAGSGAASVDLTVSAEATALKASAGSVDITSTVAATSEALIAAAGACSVAFTAAAGSSALAEAAGLVACVSAVAGAGAAVTEGVGSCSIACSVSGEAAALNSGTGAALVSSDAQGTGASLAAFSGAASIDATATAATSSLSACAGASDALLTAAATAQSLADTAGTSPLASAAAGEGRATSDTTGTISAASTVAAGSSSLYSAAGAASTAISCVGGGSSLHAANAVVTIAFGAAGSAQSSHIAAGAVAVAFTPLAVGKTKVPRLKPYITGWDDPPVQINRLAS